MIAKGRRVKQLKQNLVSEVLLVCADDPERKPPRN